LKSDKEAQREEDAVIEVHLESSKNERGDRDDDDGESLIEDNSAVPEDPTTAPAPAPLTSTALNASQPDELKHLALEQREAESFNSFTDYDAVKSGITKMADLHSLLKEHEP
jgi:hypothetical protein